MNKVFLLIIVTALTLSGCGLGMSVAKSPDDFRAMTGKEKYYTLDRFESNDSYKQVLTRLTKYAKECLAMETTLTRNGGNVMKATWTPKFEVLKGHTTMTLQKKIEGGIQIGEKSPDEDGYFMAVIDITKLKSNKAEVEYRYVSVPHHSDFMLMLRDRIKEDGRGCPNTEMYM